MHDRSRLLSLSDQRVVAFVNVVPLSLHLPPQVAD